MTDPIETYISELRDIRSSGAAVKETSYYSALSKLLNDIGQKLKPKVRCIINPRNQGAGLPDGGLFTSDQFQNAGHGRMQGRHSEAVRHERASIPPPPPFIP